MERPGVLQFDSCVRGYHVYKDGWSPVRDETLACQRETGNAHDPFAVKVVKSGSIVGHLPKKDQFNVLFVFKAWRSYYL